MSESINSTFWVAAQSVASRVLHSVSWWRDKFLSFGFGPVLVELSTFQPEKPGLSLLENLHQAGFSNPILFGGALRDDYFRNQLGMDVPTNDYDVRAGVDMKKILGDTIDSKIMKFNLIKHVQKSFPGCHIRSALINLNLCDILCTGGIIFSHQGIKIDLMFDTETALLPLRERMWADAPLDMIAMDRTGHVMADANFEAHAKKLIFDPYNRKALRTKLRTKLRTN